MTVNEGLRRAIGVLFHWKTLLLVSILVLSIKYSRPFCKYVCPLGAIYGCFNPVSVYRLKVDEQKCIHCGKCKQVCCADLKVWETPNHPDCIRCGDCKAACPTDAITSTLEELLQRK